MAGQHREVAASLQSSIKAETLSPGTGQPLYADVHGLHHRGEAPDLRSLVAARQPSRSIASENAA